MHDATPHATLRRETPGYQAEALRLTKDLRSCFVQNDNVSYHDARGHSMLRMSGRLLRLVLPVAAALIVPSIASAQQAAAPQPWPISPDVAYGYDADGKLMIYKMGTSNSKTLLSGAKKVKKGTFFFIGENGQLYMKSEPFLDSSGKFKYGPG